MKKKTNENYLDRIPERLPAIDWQEDEEGGITLKIENKGWANRLAQWIFGRPQFSYVHLDALGSFVWPLIDGARSIEAIGVMVEEKFGEEAHPLYERLAQYFRILDSYHFIQWK